MSQTLTDGNDTVSFASQTTVYGLDGNDVIFTMLGVPNLYGGEGNDFLGNQGSSAGDLFGGRGNDAIHGGTISDRIYGEQGEDLLVGGEFSYGSAQAGSIVPFAGELSGTDTLFGADGNDSIWGFDGDDILYGGEGDDTNTINVVTQGNSQGVSFTIAGGLYGGDGNDFLDGDRGNDFLSGGNQNDTLVGGAGNDTLNGDAGDDTIFCRPRHADP